MQFDDFDTQIQVEEVYTEDANTLDCQEEDDDVFAGLGGFDEDFGYAD